MRFKQRWIPLAIAPNCLLSQNDLNNFPSQLLPLALDLLCLVPSRLEIQNRLKPEKVEKLAFCMRNLNVKVEITFRSIEFFYHKETCFKRF